MFTVLHVISLHMCAGGESVVGVSSGRSSPLFDEFSDGEEFEFPGRKRRTSDNRSKGKGQFPLLYGD